MKFKNIKLTKKQKWILIPIPILSLILISWTILSYNHNKNSNQNQSNLIPNSVSSFSESNIDENNERIDKPTANYEQDLQRWKDRCCFKPGLYSEFYIRDKLSKESKWLYSNESSKVEGILGGTLEGTCLYFRYKKRIFYDDWYLERNEAENSNSWNDWITLGGEGNDGFYNRFYGYFDTTQPPNPSDDKYRFTYYEDGKTIK